MWECARPAPGPRPRSADADLLCVADLRKHNLSEDCERARRIILARVRTLGDSGHELVLGQSKGMGLPSTPVMGRGIRARMPAAEPEQGSSDGSTRCERDRRAAESPLEEQPRKRCAPDRSRRYRPGLEGVTIATPGARRAANREFSASSAAAGHSAARYVAALREAKQGESPFVDGCEPAVAHPPVRAASRD
jgi:hypothetical protein